MSSVLNIVRCPHPDFFHWFGETRHDHMCVACQLRVSYWPDDVRWEVADMHACRSEHPVSLSRGEQRRAYRALDRVMSRKAKAHPFTHPPLTHS